jgi:hypothetical protein
MRRVKGNEEFAKWWERWTRRIQRNRAAIRPSTLAKDGRPDKSANKPAPISGGDFKRCTSKPYDKAS